MLRFGDISFDSILWFCASGKSFFLGLLLLMVSIITPFTLYKKWAKYLLYFLRICGLLLIILSSAPLHPLFYILGVILLLGSSLRNKKSFSFKILFVVLALLITFLEIPFHILPNLAVGAMICQDDNFSKLTRRYGNLKADIVLCPTADWWTIKTSHLQVVRARAIECKYPIVRGAACGVSAAISAKGKILAQRDHYRDGPGYVIADVPVYRNKTFFSRFGHWPLLIMAAVCIMWIKLQNHEYL